MVCTSDNNNDSIVYHLPYCRIPNVKVTAPHTLVRLRLEKIDTVIHEISWLSSNNHEQEN